MNIFILDENPALAAIYHCDKHVVKMALESCQILCTIQHIKAPSSEIPYRKTHQHHPCVLWAMLSLGNYNWLLKLTVTLFQEYTFRYNRVHKSYAVFKWIINHPLQFKTLKLTDFVQVMPEAYKAANPVVAYRNYYRLGKTNILQYTRREKPFWL